MQQVSHFSRLESLNSIRLVDLSSFVCTSDFASSYLNCIENGFNFNFYGTEVSAKLTEESVGLNTPKQVVRVTPCAHGAWGTGTTARTE